MGLPLVGMVTAVVAVTTQQRGPQAAGRGRAPTVQHPDNNLLGGPLHGQPQPNIALLAAHKCLHLIGFQCRMFFNAPFSGTGAAAEAKPVPLFFSNLAIVMRATPVVRTMLRCGLRTMSKAPTWAYCVALAVAVGTNHT